MTDQHLAQTFLAKVRQLGTVQDCGGRVGLVCLYLHWVIEVNVESVAGAVRVELLSIVCQNLAAVFQLYPHVVVGGAVAGAVHAEADHEYSPVHTELNAVTATPVSPLVGPVGAGLEPVAGQRLHPQPGGGRVVHLGLLLGGEIEENIRRLLQAEHPTLGGGVGKLLQVHAGKSDALHCGPQDLSANLVWNLMWCVVWCVV